MALQDLFMAPQPEDTDPEDQVIINLPRSYRRTVDWKPELGDIAPNFTCQSTHGRITFHDWAEGQWTVLAGYPKMRAGISDTELVGFETHRENFEKRNAAVLGISPCRLERNINWIAEVEELFAVTAESPMLCDPGREISEMLGMWHESAPVEPTIRKTMIFDPALRLRWVSEYPSTLGRSVDEILRVLDGLILFDAKQLGAPMDWMPGDPAIVRPDMSTAMARRVYGDSVVEVTPRIRTVDPDAVPEGG
ncbi:redoxin domain-containing protein [Roseovarius sp. SCSIO 43702]|uniref:redoxin domain-containing protein n=1 Tax=Roseovarius sp. SCSIO 43702 TaxID=2823043 RepID=UPI001C732A7F|nr:redoxin domain-containing protein [Roseovarius sp. SCSIO 43702]QYX57723.1 redoxin domain-containing protein [Roseovarius sp. SCSIO 43702]